MPRDGEALSLYPISEVFATVQGEGTWTGKPAWFVRFQGCPVGCGWCDTKHTWHLDPTKKGDCADVLAKTHDWSPVWAEFDVLSLLEAFTAAPGIRHVVITGGEPCVHDLRLLTESLNQAGYATQIETSGCFEVLCSFETWVTVSPKVGMPGNLPVLDTALARASEIKYPVGKSSDLQDLKGILPRVRRAAPIYLQPLSLSRRATQLCIEAAMENGWSLSVQTHKYIGVR